MDLNRKVEIAKTAINSITQHDDEDLSVRRAAATLVIEHVTAELKAAEKRVADRAAAVLGAKEA